MSTTQHTNDKERETITAVDHSYGAIVKRQFKKNKLALWSLRIIYLLII